MPVETRIHFHEELARLEEQALGGLDLVVSALDRTTEALEQQDLELAAMVIADDDKIDGRYLEVHQGVLSLMARQAPVATDLRLIAALLDVIKHFERMGDQCVNISKLIRLTGPHVPRQGGSILSRTVEMGRQARAQILQAKRAFAERNVELAEDLVVQDDRIDELNRECFQLALDIGDDVHAREWAMHMMLAARAFERLGDLAVDIGEQTAFVVTGLFYEFTDASHPEVAPPSVQG
jgi:phosphate transport system protein